MAAYRSNGFMSRISTTDFSQAVLQADEHADGQKRLMKCRDVHDKNKFVCAWCKGPIYGEQDACALCAATRDRAFINEMGFEPAHNADSVYINKEQGVITSCHTDDPITVCRDEKAEQWFYQTLAKHLLIKEVVCLEANTVIDYLSMRLTMSEEGAICQRGPPSVALLARVWFIFRNGRWNCGPLEDCRLSLELGR